MNSFRLFIQRMNERIAIMLSNSLSSMICFWVICVMVIAVLQWQVPKNPLEWIEYLVQTFFQGVALPVLAFVAKKEGEESRKMNTETHDIVMGELKDLKQFHEDLAILLKKPRCHEIGKELQK